MKLEIKNQVDYNSKEYDLESQEARIDPEQLAKMWEMFANPYKNNIGSIVRELTSNCFDSHIEAKVNDAVVITLAKDDSGVYIKFSDVGVGLSPERISKIYLSYLNSTKSDSNDYIGAFGIGSKSPLSYVDLFFIDTIYEGIKYSYIMRKGITKPAIDKIMEMPVDQRNGTDIKLYIHEGVQNNDNYYLGDIGNFCKEIKEQLTFFDNVYVNIDSTLGFIKPKIEAVLIEINNFTIYEGKHFVYRTDNSNNLNACVGKVNYPIDYKLVYPGLNKQIPLNIALKFDIGELMVTYSREELRYNDDVIKKIREKTKLAITELFDKFNVQLQSKGYDDFDKYWVDKVNFHTFSVVLDKDKNININLENFINGFLDLPSNVDSTYKSNTDDIRNNTEKFNESIINCNLNSILSKHIDLIDLKINNIYLKKLEGTTLENTPNYVLSQVYTCTKEKKRQNINFTKARYRQINFLGAAIKDKKNKLIIIDDTVGDKKPVISKKFLTYIQEELGCKGEIHIIDDYNKSLAIYKTFLNHDVKIYKDKSKWRKYIKVFQELFEKYVTDNSLYLSDLLSKATNEWYDKYKKDNGLVNKSVKRDDTQITIRRILDLYSKPNYPVTDYSINRFAGVDYRNESCNYTIDEIKIKLNGKKGLFFTKEDSKKYNALLFLTKNLLTLGVEKVPFMSMISRLNMKKLEDAKLTIDYKDYLVANKDLYIKVYTAVNYFNELDLSKLVNQRQSMNTMDYSKKLLIYYLMGNKELLNEIKKLDKKLLNIKTYLEIITDTDRTLFKDNFKVILDHSLSLANEVLDLDKEAKLNVKSIEDAYLDYNTVIENNLSYLQLISKVGTYGNGNVNISEKDKSFILFHDFKLVDELSIIKKGSLFDTKLTKDTTKQEIVQFVKDLFVDQEYNYINDNVSFLSSTFMSTDIYNSYSYGGTGSLGSLKLYITSYVEYLKLK